MAGAEGSVTALEREAVGADYKRLSVQRDVVFINLWEESLKGF